MGSIRIGARFFQTADTPAVLAWRGQSGMVATGCGVALPTLMGFPGSVEQIWGYLQRGYHNEPGCRQLQVNGPPHQVGVN